MKDYLTIKQLKERNWSESLLRRIAHSEEADRFCFRTSPRGKYLFDVTALEAHRHNLKEVE